MFYSILNPLWLKYGDMQQVLKYNIKYGESLQYTDNTNLQEM